MRNKSLYKFPTKIAHDAVYNGEGYKEPWTALTVEDKVVTYNKVKSIDPKNTVGSIAYYDGSDISFVAKDKWNANLGTPIGVVVAPASHMPDGKCRIMSLCNMSYVTPTTGTLGTGYDNTLRIGTNLKWGEMMVDTPLTNYEFLMHSNGESDSPGNLGLPSDLWKGRTSVDDVIEGTLAVTTLDNPVDTKTAWCLQLGESASQYPTPMLISPYDTDGSRNPLADTEGQGLADLDGAANTSALVNLSAIKDSYRVGEFANEEANYPAAFACHLFRTDGTAGGDWYLPAIGELAYLFVRIIEINQTLELLGESAVLVGDRSRSGSTYGTTLWSSTEQNEFGTWVVYYDGQTNGGGKGDALRSLRVRAFCAI